MAEITSDDIVSAASKPNQITGDAGSVTMPTIDELIKAAQFSALMNAAAAGRTGIRYTKTIAPGAVSDQQQTGIDTQFGQGIF